MFLVLTVKEGSTPVLNATASKIPIISLRLIFFQKAFLLGLFSGEVIFGGTYYWTEFCLSVRVGLDNKTSVKHDENSLKQPVHGHIIGRASLLSEGFLRL